MTALLASLVEGDAVLKAAAAALIAGIGLSVTVSLAILGTTEASELRRGGRRVAAAISLGLGILALAVAAAVVVAGLALVISG